MSKRKTSEVPRKGKYALQVKRSRAGLGLFADEDIPKDAFVIEYFGEVIPTEEADLRGGKFLFDISKTKVVDGKSRANIARYINHACKPNCETDVRGGRIYVYTRRKIKKGEELSYDYGKEYFDEFIRPHGCQCVSCRAKVKRA